MLEPRWVGGRAHLLGKGWHAVMGADSWRRSCFHEMGQGGREGGLMREGDCGGGVGSPR